VRRAVAASCVLAALAAAVAPRETGYAGEPAAPKGGGAPASPPAAKWLDDPGTAVLGLGLLRVAPSKPGVPGSLRLDYEEKPSDYAAFDAVQLFVLGGDAFADGRAFGDETLAFARSPSGSYAAKASVAVTAPALLVVGYGPFVGPDTGRPLSLARAYSLTVGEAKGVSHRWVDPEAGELNVKGWTNRPEVKRGGPVVDPVTGASHWFEARLEVVYDRDRLRAPGDAETADALARRSEAATLRARAKAEREAGRPDAAKDLEAEAQDLLDQVAASDDRLPVPGALAERLRRLPFRWK
jgi:hypothetical protein